MAAVKLQKQVDQTGTLTGVGTGAQVQTRQPVVEPGSLPAIRFDQDQIIARVTPEQPPTEAKVGGAVSAAVDALFGGGGTSVEQTTRAAVNAPVPPEQLAARRIEVERHLMTTFLGDASEPPRVMRLDELLRSSPLAPERDRLVTQMAYALERMERNGQLRDRMSVQTLQNRPHLFDELGRLMSLIQGLSPPLTSHQALLVALASVGSDHVKIDGRVSLLTHHLRGMESTALSMRAEGFSEDDIQQVQQLILAHQATPPFIMAGAFLGQVREVLGAAGVESEVAVGLSKKLRDPMAQASENGAMVLSPAERELAREVGLGDDFAWPVPEGRLAGLLIAADGVSNYLPPWKILDIRKPGGSWQPPDATLAQALDSVYGANGSAVSHRKVLAALVDQGQLEPMVLERYDRYVDRAKVRTEKAQVMAEPALLEVPSVRQWLRANVPEPAGGYGHAELEQLPYFRAPLPPGADQATVAMAADISQVLQGAFKLSAEST